eukprot:UN18607
MSGYFQAYLLANFSYTNLSTKIILSTLSCGLGCFPLDVSPFARLRLNIKIKTFTL